GYEGEPTPRSPALHSSSRDQGVRADALEAFAPEQPAPAERDLPAAGRADTHPRTAPPDADTGPALGEVEEQPRRDPLALPVAERHPRTYRFSQATPSLSPSSRLLYDIART